MDEFVISYAGEELVFFDRLPPNRSEPLDYFSFRISQPNLTAQRRVYGYLSSDLAQFFADMARQWDGWQGELVWTSLESELTLRCSHDGLGHISIRVDLRSGSYLDDWQLLATVKADAGQLEEVADATRSDGKTGQAGNRDNPRNVQGVIA